MKTEEKKAQHTKGPWEVKQTAVYDAVYGPNGELISFVGIREPHEIQANAYLISAAPDLLDALKKAIDQMKEICGPHGDYSYYEATIAKAEKTKEGG